MVHRILALPTVLGVVLLIGCRGGSDDAGSGTPLPAEAPLEGASRPSGQPGGENRTDSRDPFGRGVMHVFGIKIPTGMKPARGPEKVYRFEGTLPPARVAGLIREQIHAEEAQPEAGGGFLFRFAKPKKSTAATVGDRGIAIRIAATPTGSHLDIWLEREHVNALPGTAATADFPVEKRPGPVRTILKKADRQAEAAHRALLMGALRKLQQGEPLTPEEEASGVYD